MIGDLCKPLNPGESMTVRLVACVEEARELDLLLDAACGPLRPHKTNQRTTAIENLRYILKSALVRNDVLEAVDQ